VEKLVKILNDRGDITVAEYFFLAVLIVVGTLVAIFRYVI
jgi:hypothetical protein